MELSLLLFNEFILWVSLWTQCRTDHTNVGTRAALTCGGSLREENCNSPQWSSWHHGQKQERLKNPTVADIFICSIICQRSLTTYYGTDFIFLGSKSTVDGGCSHAIKRRLLLGGKPVSNLDSIIKWQRRYTKVRIVKAVVFPVVIYGHESGTVKFSSVQWLSWVRLNQCKTPWTAARQASLFITNSWSLLKLMSIESVMPSNHLILCRPLLLLPSIPPSIRVFSNEPVSRIRWPEYWSFSFSISPSNEHPGLTSFRMDWLDLLAVQGTLDSSQHHSSKASILQHSAFFIVQLSHPCMTTGKTIALPWLDEPLLASNVSAF